MQYATYAPIWEEGGVFDKIYVIDRMGVLGTPTVAGSVDGWAVWEVGNLV